MTVKSLFLGPFHGRVSPSQGDHVFCKYPPYYCTLFLFFGIFTKCKIVPCVIYMEWLILAIFLVLIMVKL